MTFNETILFYMLCYAGHLLGLAVFKIGWSFYTGMKND